MIVRIGRPVSLGAGLKSLMAGFRCFASTDKGASECLQIKAVIFDMDGTLTEPVLNFTNLRRLLSVPHDKDILQTVYEMKEKEKERAFDIIRQFEEEGMKNLKFQSGVDSLLRYLSNHDGMKIGLITRNNQSAVNHFMKTFDEQFKGSRTCNEIFSQVLTRDFKPAKPHPASALHVCSCWGIDPKNAVFVGDDATDMQCGNSAGTATVLLRNNRNLDACEIADVTIDCLDEFIDLLQSPFMVKAKKDTK